MYADITRTVHFDPRPPSLKCFTGRLKHFLGNAKNAISGRQKLESVVEPLNESLGFSVLRVVKRSLTF